MSDVDIKGGPINKPPRRTPARRAAIVLPGLPSVPEPEALPPAMDRAAVPASPPKATVIAEPDPEPTTTHCPPAAVSAVQPAEEPTMDTINTATETAHETVNTAADKSRALFADWNSRGKDALEKSAKAWDELGAFYRGNIEAMVESSRIAAKGIESFGQHAAELTRKSLEDATNATRTLSQTKSPTEFLKLQGDLARSAFDLMVAETSRSTETMLKLAGDVAQPVANRLAVAADKMKTIA